MTDVIQAYDRTLTDEDWESLVEEVNYDAETEE